jgi:transcriptional regulator with XRE-family HTH domain
MDDRERGPFGRALLDYRTRAGLSQPRLGGMLDLRRTRQAISQWERGVCLPDDRDAGRLDTALHAGGDLLAIWRQARLAERARADGTDLEGVDPTDRRELLHTTGLFAAAGVAATISDRIAEAALPPRTLREIEHDVEGIATEYPSTSAVQLVPRAERGWLGVERLLDGRVRGRTRTVLDLHAGQYAVYLALTANDLGQHQVADTYLDLAGQHAEQAGDQLLGDCVAILESSFAFFRGQPERARIAAADRRADAHPYARPMLAVCEARAAARAGDAGTARAGLDDMWSHLWVGPTRPGTVPVDEALAVAQTAAILSTLGDPASEEYARRAIAGWSGAGANGMLGGSYNALARSYLRRPEPDPEQAADAARRAVLTVGEQRTSWVVDVSTQMWRQMDARWPTLPAVRQLGERLAESRAALPPGG